MVGSTTSPSGRGVSSCARSGEAPRSRPSGSAASRILARPGSSRSYWGGYVQGSYFLLPHRLQVAARAGHTDLPLYGATLAQRLLAGSTQNEQSGVVSSYVHGHRVKAQLEYSHLTSNGLTAPTIHRIQAAVQVGF